MSQAKVDKYKKEKANRQQIMKQQKRQKTMWKIGGGVAGLLVVCWIGFSVVNMMEQNEAQKPIVSQTYEVNSDAITDYLSGIEVEDAE